MNTFREIVEERKDFMDRRTKKTRKNIKDTFLSYLSVKPLSKITVAEIAKDLDINRGTFYLHYHDVFDLYDSFVDEVIYNSLMILRESYSPKKHIDYLFLSSQLVIYFEKNYTLLNLLLESELGDDTIRKLEEALVQEVIMNENLQQTDQLAILEIHFTISGIISVLSKWMVKEDRLSTIEIKNLLTSILTKLNTAN